MINIKNVAKLANIKISKEEETIFKKQLGSIISFISHLSEVDTDDINLNKISNSLKNVSRKDVISTSMKADEALSNTKSQHNNYFKVELVLKNKIL